MDWVLGVLGLIYYLMSLYQRYVFGCRQYGGITERERERERERKRERGKERDQRPLYVKSRSMQVREQSPDTNISLNKTVVSGNISS
jgi:hypothetical protein